MLQNSTVVKILSLIIAISLWGYVVWTDNPIIKQTFNNVPVQILNLSSLEERGLVLLDEQEYTVNVKLEGQKKDVANISASDITVTADIGGYGVGESEVTVNVRAFGGATVIEVNPSKITFHIDEIVTAEKPVVSALSGSVPENTEVGDFELPVETVTVRGPSTVVSNVARVAAHLDLLKLTEEEAPQILKLTAENGRNEAVEGLTIEPRTLEVSAKLDSVKEVPLTIDVVGEPADGCDLSHVTVPDFIKIKGNQSTLENVSNITGRIDISGMSQSGRVQVALALPTGTMLSRENPRVVVSVTIINPNDEVPSDNATPGTNPDSGNAGDQLEQGGTSVPAE